MTTDRSRSRRPDEGVTICGMGKLTPAEINDYFALHLPYRIGIMLAHYKMTHDSAGNDIPWTGNPAWANACFVASLVTARLFLNVLGIGKKGGSLADFDDKPDDVTVDDLGGKRLDPAKLSQAEHDSLFDFLKMADKAAAHFTTPIVHDWSKTHDVIKLILHYLKTNLYDAAGRSGLEPLI
jgi:hypothetical protein